MSLHHSVADKVSKSRRDVFIKRGWQFIRGMGGGRRWIARKPGPGGAMLATFRGCCIGRLLNQVAAWEATHGGRG